MHLEIVLLTLCYSWPGTEGDWIRPEHSRFQSLHQHRSLVPVVEDAKPAECKVRPKVIEITRSMVDPTTANFFVWPSCVEVQRCSGCCNTRNYKCQATKVQERRVQVRKSVYKHRRRVPSTAVVVLIDHVECKCMTAAQYTDSQEREGPLVTAAPIVVRTRKYSSGKRKHQKFKHIAGEKGTIQT
ncbi:platelet-derived growth factor subunit B-like [Heptranchias perlo]|uniref:platelet-derived growth factor subunit B-like n=1 Tax=Heptranchias perlo TaxID=212740 RepID=UPI003559BA3C